jgi:hypothetical protein
MLWTAGSVLVYSTYIGGGSETDYATGIAVDGAGNAYVTPPRLSLPATTMSHRPMSTSTPTP